MAKRRATARRTTRTSKGRRSRFEDRITDQLEALGVRYDYEGIRLAYTPKDRVYIPDFTITRPRGSVIHVEAKGYFTSADRSKMLAVKREYPELDIRFVFQRNNTLSKKSKTTYAEWAAANGFPWAVGEIPEAWLI